MSNALLTGSTQTGKSTRTRQFVVERIRRRDAVVVLLDPQPESTAFKTMQDLSALGLDKNVIYERLGDTTRVLPLDFLEPSDSPDRHERRMINKIMVEEMTDNLCGGRDFTTIVTHPLIREWTENLLYLGLTLAKRRTLANLMLALRPGTKQQAQLLDDCPAEEEELAYRFRSLPRRCDLLERIVGPAVRFLHPFATSPVIAARDFPYQGFPIEEYLDHGKHIFVEGGWNTSVDDIRMILRYVAMRVANYKRRGGKRMVLLILEEAALLRLVGWHLSVAIGMLQKRGFDVIIICQVPFFIDDQVTDNVFQNTPYHAWWRCDSQRIARLGALDLEGIVNPWRVHHVETRKRQEVVGWEEREFRNAATKYKRDGKPELTTSTHKSERPIYRIAQDRIEHYMPPQDQVLEMEGTIMSLDLDERFIKYEGRIEHQQPSKLEDLWVFSGLGEKKALKAIQRIKQLPCFRAPRVELPVEKPKGAAARLNGGNGAKPSGNGSAATRRLFSN